MAASSHRAIRFGFKISRFERDSVGAQECMLCNVAASAARIITLFATRAVCFYLVGSIFGFAGGRNLILMFMQNHSTIPWENLQNVQGCTGDITVLSPRDGAHLIQLHIFAIMSS